VWEEEKIFSVDVRIIAATNSNLKAATTNGTFRADLYFRLRVMPLHVPQLRERGDDIGLLVDHFLRAMLSEVANSNRDSPSGDARLDVLPVAGKRS